MILVVCLSAALFMGNSNPRQDKIKRLYIEYARQFKGYSSVKIRDLEVVRLNKLSFIKTAVYKVSFNGIHPREYFYFIISGNKIDPISSPGYKFYYNTLNRFIDPGRLKSYNNAKSMASWLADVRSFGYPDIIINDIEEIKSKIFPQKYAGIKNIIKPLNTRMFKSSVIITFYTLGRFDGALHFNTVTINSDSIECVKNNIIKDVTSKHALE